MATLMEKDVLLELVATGLGEISRAELRGDIVENMSNTDRIYLIDMRRKLYTSSEKDWDFKKTADKIKAVSEKYQLRS